MKTHRHVLVTGSHRSGTTWVGKTLACLPGIDYIHEPFNADEEERYSDPSISFKVKTWFLLAPGSAEEDALRSALERRFRGSTDPWLSVYDICRARGFKSVRAPLRFAKHLMLRTMRRHRVLMKDPIALFSAPWLHEQFDMHVVCMIRNPLAFAGSLKKWGWTFDFRHLARQTRLVEGRLARFSAAIFEHASQPKDIVDQASLLWNCFHHVINQYQTEYPDWCYVRHEDLAAQPLEGFRRLCESLGLDLTPKLSEEIRQMTSADAPAEADSPAFQKRNSRLSLETWRNRLTQEEAGRVIQATEECASAYYQFNGESFE